jgi:uncharacterized protein YeaO (DUF488 family)
MVAAGKRKTERPAKRPRVPTQYSSPACMLHEVQAINRASDVPDVRIKRIYEDPQSVDGLRVLVDCLWPRGIRRQQAAIDIWARELAPSTQLRQWFQHDPKRWNAFRQRYRKELREKASDLMALRERSHSQRVTLLYAAKDQVFNHAAVLLEVLRRK